MFYNIFIRHSNERALMGTKYSGMLRLVLSIKTNFVRLSL